MEFLEVNSVEELGKAVASYQAHLEAIKDRLPPEAYEFATASWHYDPSDHRSLHDSWIEELAIREAPAVIRNELHKSPMSIDAREWTIDVRLLGPYHDGHTVLQYRGVRAYRLDGKTESDQRGPRWRGHGDWLVDEVRLANSGAVLHEILFASGSRWLIECESITYSTTIPPIHG